MLKHFWAGSLNTDSVRPFQTQPHLSSNNVGFSVNVRKLHTADASPLPVRQRLFITAVSVSPQTTFSI